MWCDFIDLFDPAFEALLKAKIKLKLFEDALEMATQYEKKHGLKHNSWDKILEGLVEQDEIREYGY